MYRVRPPFGGLLVGRARSFAATDLRRRRGIELARGRARIARHHHRLGVRLRRYPADLETLLLSRGPTPNVWLVPKTQRRRRMGVARGLPDKRSRRRNFPRHLHQLRPQRLPCRRTRRSLIFRTPPSAFRIPHSAYVSLDPPTSAFCPPQSAFGPRPTTSAPVARDRSGNSFPKCYSLGGSY